MNQENFLGRLVAKLEDAGIPYMITGLLGSSLHGEPRATNDIDLVIAPTAAQLTTFIQSLSEGYYVSPKVAQEALQNMQRNYNFHNNRRKSMILAEMTSPEVDALPRDIVVLMPVASCEQHSLHLPVFTDSLIGQEVARRVHERCPDDVLVLPMQWLGYSQHHIRYPGTISAISETHLLLMMDIVASMVGHGFEKIFIQNSHGGNGSNISVLLQRLMERYGDSGAEFYSRWAWASGGILDEIRELGGAGSGHAGETETCMIMAIDPSLVRTDRLDPDGERDGMRVAGMASYYRFDQRTRHGGVGDPRPATAEKGERMLDASADEIAEQIKQIRTLRPFD